MLFTFSEDIRKAIYNTDALESLKSLTHRAIKNRKLFLIDDSTSKVGYDAVINESKK
jgi:putative transposase